MMDAEERIGAEEKDEEASVYIVILRDIKYEVTDANSKAPAQSLQRGRRDKKREFFPRVFSGVVITNPVDKEAPKTLLYRRLRIQETNAMKLEIPKRHVKSLNFVGTPMVVLHKEEEYPVGEITNQHITDNGDVYINYQIYKPTATDLVSGEAYRQVENGNLSGLSARTHRLYYANAPDETLAHRGMHVALVHVGARTEACTFGQKEHEQYMHHSSGGQIHASSCDANQQLTASDSHLINRLFAGSVTLSEHSMADSKMAAAATATATPTTEAIEQKVRYAETNANQPVPMALSSSAASAGHGPAASASASASGGGGGGGGGGGASANRRPTLAGEANPEAIDAAFSGPSLDEKGMRTIPIPLTGGIPPQIAAHNSRAMASAANSSLFGNSRGLSSGPTDSYPYYSGAGNSSSASSGGGGGGAPKVPNPPTDPMTTGRLVDVIDSMAGLPDETRAQMKQLLVGGPRASKAPAASASASASAASEGDGDTSMSEEGQDLSSLLSQISSLAGSSNDEGEAEEAESEPAAGSGKKQQDTKGGEAEEGVAHTKAAYERARRMYEDLIKDKAERKGVQVSKRQLDAVARAVKTKDPSGALRQLLTTAAQKSAANSDSKQGQVGNRQIVTAKRKSGLRPFVKNSEFLQSFAKLGGGGGGGGGGQLRTTKTDANSNPIVFDNSFRCADLAPDAPTPVERLMNGLSVVSESDLLHDTNTGVSRRRIAHDETNANQSDADGDSNMSGEHWMPPHMAKMAPSTAQTNVKIIPYVPMVEMPNDRDLARATGVPSHRLPVTLVAHSIEYVMGRDIRAGLYGSGPREAAGDSRQATLPAADAFM